MKTLNKKFSKKNKLAFTLVELIIVITILAILATIAFISFQGYTKDSRDTNRLATINSLEKGLQIHQVKVGKLPLPENAINITYSGTVIGYQGIFGEKNSRLINMSKIPLDPLDDTSFTYNVNSDLNAYQITGFFESKSTLAENNLLQKTYAGNIDYSSRVPRTFGKELGVLLLNTGTDLNRPLQEKYNASSFTGIDVKTFNGTLPSLGNVGNLKVVMSSKNNDVIIGTGAEISRLESLASGKIKLIMSECKDSWKEKGTVFYSNPEGTISVFLKKVCEGSDKNTIPNGVSIGVSGECPSGFTKDISNRFYDDGALGVTFNCEGDSGCSICKSNGNLLSGGTKAIMTECGNGWKKTSDLILSDPGAGLTFGYNDENTSFKICEKE